MQKVRNVLVSAIVSIPLVITSSVVPAGAAPSQTEIRLVTPVLTTDNAYRNYDDPGYWVSQGWFPDGITYRQVYAPIGSTINLTWLVTDPSTKTPLADTAVTLRLNKAYSQSNARVQVGPVTTSGVEKFGLDQGRAVAKTDQFGYVTFQMVNLDDPKNGAEPQPTKLNSKAKVSGDNPLGDPNIALYAQIKPEILGEKNDIVDFVEFHFYKPNSATTPDTSGAVVAPLAPSFTAEDSAKKDGVLQKYAAVGKSFLVAYGVTNGAGLPIAGADVELTANAAGSGATAPVGIAGATAAAGSSKSVAKSDAFGNVVFQVSNTVTKGEPKPAALNSLPPTSGAIFARFQAALSGSTATSAPVDFHFFQTAAPVTPTPVKKTIRCQKGKTIKKVTAVAPKCPTGFKKI